jgi:hypothetical protein
VCAILEIVKEEDMAINAKVELRIAAMQVDNLSEQLRNETSQLLGSDAIKNAYSPSAWIRLSLILRSVTRGMAIIRMHASGKSQAEIEAATGCTSTEIAAYKAWNTMYASGLGLKIQPPVVGKNGKVSKKRQAKYDSDIAFLKSCGIAFEEE